MKAIYGQLNGLPSRVVLEYYALFGTGKPQSWGDPQQSHQPYRDAQLTPMLSP
jgi:hypothetical protein